jgi:hypothetical protein
MREIKDKARKPKAFRTSGGTAANQVEVLPY